MAEARGATRRNGPVERVAAAVPPPAGRAFRFIALSLLAIATAALIAIAAQLVLVLQRLEAGSDVAALKADVAGLKTEVGAFHADVGKAMTALQKSSAETADRVNTATIQLNDIGLGLHKAP